MKIVHFSDAHLRNFKLHREFKQSAIVTFSKMLRSEIKPDIIVNAGDIVHAKTSISPEAYVIAKEFFKSLSSIAPL